MLSFKKLSFTKYLLFNWTQRAAFLKTDKQIINWNLRKVSCRKFTRSQPHINFRLQWNFRLFQDFTANRYKHGRCWFAICQDEPTKQNSICSASIKIYGLYSDFYLLFLRLKDLTKEKCWIKNKQSENKHRKSYESSRGSTTKARQFLRLQGLDEFYLFSMVFQRNVLFRNSASRSQKSFSAVALQKLFSFVSIFSAFKSEICSNGWWKKKKWNHSELPSKFWQTLSIKRSFIKKCRLRTIFQFVFLPSSKFIKASLDFKSFYLFLGNSDIHDICTTTSYSSSQTVRELHKMEKLLDSFISFIAS